MKLWELVGKHARLTFNNGEIIEGEILDWTDDYTSISGEEEIVIGTCIYAESDYKTIEIIEK
ncbi:4-hydroxy-3-methylbut-2-enyl diphosphate reductase [Enterococcus sp. 669A]|uniref:4-hydroxy-3-methylbut-2-enyl diphosphate reductase n=1 Tax=Candidatus Enterococcus moelleringii TaxID=2815325 RepID=A0ABS3LAA4_9ENTE|nr:4-hydroxy-3-methylbut-2-enyl diphosphate reductase [Enterococcus sp. 669A]MBO1306551.1 4-hydroxy-3-methylbut-2-enyl diphosphate reductase [Enterococcus sp. 669A]